MLLIIAMGQWVTRLLSLHAVDKTKTKSHGHGVGLKYHAPLVLRGCNAWLHAEQAWQQRPAEYHVAVHYQDVLLFWPGFPEPSGHRVRLQVGGVAAQRPHGVHMSGTWALLGHQVPTPPGTLLHQQGRLGAH